MSFPSQTLFTRNTSSKSKNFSYNSAPRIVLPLSYIHICKLSNLRTKASWDETKNCVYTSMHGTDTKLATNKMLLQDTAGSIIQAKAPAL
jgi:hypothetical protein